MEMTELVPIFTEQMKVWKSSFQSKYPNFNLTLEEESIIFVGFQSGVRKIHWEHVNISSVSELCRKLTWLAYQFGKELAPEQKKNFEFRTGVYQHFKGAYYYAKKRILDATTGEDKIIYYAIEDDFKEYARNPDSFFDDVSNRVDNSTGQKHRFQLIPNSQFSIDGIPSTPSPKFLNTFKQVFDIGDHIHLIFEDEDEELCGKISGYSLIGIVLAIEGGTSYTYRWDAINSIIKFVE